MDKKTLRSNTLSAITQMSEDMRQIEDCKVYKNIVKLDSYQKAKTIFLYMSVSYEVDTYKIVEHALCTGKRVAVPRCREKGMMDAVQLYSIKELIPDRYGIPSAPCQNPIIQPEELDFILVPAVAFDQNGNRLGRGGGYYDRYLARVPSSVRTVGICRAAQMLSDISCDALDVPVQCVVTPDQVYGG